MFFYFNGLMVKMVSQGQIKFSRYKMKEMEDRGKRFITFNIDEAREINVKY
ncbi:MAG: hypothetical protein N2645_02355 [Clostridia bacterium]|nr:hypothetical protein [Clostridia bacterium]